VTRETIRIDKFLWHARLVKTRSLAARLCDSGCVELGGSPVTRPAQPVRIGDELVVLHGGRRRRVRVLAFGTRRGPVAEARTLYEDTAAPERIPAGDPGWEPLLPDDE
jgi:ribosome-associated heat shock protein Hsp15